jgi:CelD/BcsL family acetyltransferase involved in cellulose biosynthesis
MNLHGELLSADAAADLADEWRAIAEAQGNAFLTPEWFFAWRRHYAGPKSSPMLVVVRDPAGGLAGLLPLARVGRTTQFAGANVGDWFGPLARTGLELEVATAAAETLFRAGHRTLVLHNVDQDASWVSALVQSWPGPMTRRRLHSTVIPFVPLAGTWETFLENRSRNFRSQVRRKERNLQRNHGLEFRMVRDSSELRKAMETFFDLHRARWSGDGRGSSLASGNAESYHMDFAGMALERGWLRLWFLMAEGRAVAAWYGWMIGGRYCYFNAGWDPAWSHESVGLVLLAHTIRSAIEEGAEEYSLLLGDEAYKARFAVEQRPIETVALAHPLSLSQCLIHLDIAGRRLAKALPPELKARLGKARAVKLLPGSRPA